jgi:stringent starvation protein B
MSGDSKTLSKREALESLLSQGDVLIQIDPRGDGVDVPAHLTAQPLVVLRIGHDMPVPIPDLTLGHQRLEATLSFNRQPYFVSVPWAAVFGMVSENGQGLLWTGDVPDEVLEQMVDDSEEDGEDGGREGQAGRSARGGARLVALDGGRSCGTAAGVGADSGRRQGEDPDPDEEGDPEPDPEPSGPPTLRVIK